MSRVELLLAIPFGVAIGVVVGTVGGGGAILALPVLVYVLDEGVSPASTASLIVVALGASFGAGSQARDGQLCWKLALGFSIPAALGAYLGTLANEEVAPRTLVLAFVPVMLLAAALTYRRSDESEVGEDEGGEKPKCPPAISTRAGTSGFGVGAMTGFFGVGGGFLIVPALTMLLGLSVRRAIATSLAIITLTGLAALASHLAEGSRLGPNRCACCVCGDRRPRGELDGPPPRTWGADPRVRSAGRSSRDLPPDGRTGPRRTAGWIAAIAERGARLGASTRRG